LCLFWNQPLAAGIRRCGVPPLGGSIIQFYHNGITIKIKSSKSIRIAAAGLSITLPVALFLLIIWKSSIFKEKESTGPATIFSDDGKKIAYGKTSCSMKNNKPAVIGDTKGLRNKNTSETSKVAIGGKSDKTVEELSKEFLAMDNDAKINYITNLESFDPDIIALVFSDKSEDVRLAAAKSLCWFETDQKNILPFIALAMNDVSRQLRDESYKLMDSLDDKNDVLILMESSMNSDFSDVRLTAVSKFIDLDISREDVKALVVKALSDDDKEVRRQSILSASFLWDQEFSSEDEAIKYLSKR
jgi:hypothetical protein